MTDNPSALLDVSLQQIRAGWVDKLEIKPSNLERANFTLIPRESSYGITALKFFDSIVAICQPTLLPILSPLSPDDFFDLPLLLKCLSAYKMNPIGIASISYADSGTLTKSAHLAAVHEGNLKEVEAILSACDESEQEESGVATMPVIFIAESTTRKPGAVASYEIWNDKIAQLGVLAKPEYRGQGLASSAVETAAQNALSLSLIPQWRCRIGNANSERLSQRLGFQKVGLQLAIDVVPS